MHIVIIGGSAVGQTLAERLHTDRNEVVFVDENAHASEQAEKRGIDTHLIEDIRSVISVDSLDVDGTSIIIVATERDSTNLLIAQLVRNQFGVRRLIVRVNDPRNWSMFTDLGFDAVCSTGVLATALAEVVGAGPRMDVLHEDDT
ncbi:NAD-binding protein [Halocatena salina]|uniref:NAD-binding protein n=1 Tax=Halocatena salina TaxID=2934340 RepID=A0A8U0A144_9EURY|nr:NAD-binding protein [Halocatena salina]UPM42168.1 NAD-binding protein [Halocatena salina]